MKIGYLNSIIQNIPIKTVCKIYYLRWWYNGWHYWAFRPGETNMITEGESYRTIGTRKVTMGSGHISYNQVQAIRTILLTREVYILTSYGWKNIRVDQGSVITYKNQINGYEIEITTTIGSKEISLTGYSPVDDIPEVDPGDPGICERTIGSQIWACKNYDSKYPGSKVYNDNEANRDIYGGLYKYSQVMSPGFCPPGWHVPELAEWQTLIDFVGGLAVAGGILKEAGTDHWDAGIDGTDDYGFAALGAGYWFNTYGYINLKKETYFWAPTDIGPNPYYIIRMTNISAAVVAHSIHPNHFNSVRLVKDTPPIFDDYFLPSKDELNQMHVNLYLMGIGGLNAGTYWSSTEDSASFSWYQRFSTGLPGADLKGSANQRVRACRMFTAVVGAYSLGDSGPAGGWIFYIAGTTYYEAAPTDTSPGHVWSGEILAAIGTTSAAIGEGQNNTDEIIAQPDLGTSAARLCKDLVT